MIDPTWIAQRHSHWWRYLIDSQRFLPNEFNRSTPVIRYVAKPARAAGWATASYCEYNIAYWLQEGDKYDETICHEVCHSFTMRLLPRTANHGDLWRYLYNAVCGFKRNRYHNYRRITRATIDPRAIALCKYINLLKEAEHEVPAQAV